VTAIPGRHHAVDTDPVTARQSPETDDDPASAWSQALQPLFECAAYRLLISGTLERAVVGYLRC
jgi:hypothetical protein